jgi:DNA modification methylase
MIDLRLGDCIEVLKTLPDNSVDSIVTDPPYGLSFMGKKWDYDVPSVDIWKECLRVLKPGGHLLSFGGSRTYHRMAVAIEDAGFEVRDQIMWIYGQGFPKSHNIGKAIDKIQGNEREVVGDNPNHRKTSGLLELGFQDGKESSTITKGQSEWEGWGTSLKPAHEPICMARKPLTEKSIAENVLKHGTGGINIDGSRISFNANDKFDIRRYNEYHDTFSSYEDNGSANGKYVVNEPNQEGRFPANIMFECTCDEVIPGDKGEIKISKYNTDGYDNTHEWGFDVSKAVRKTRTDTADTHTNPNCPCYILDQQSGKLNKQGKSKTDNKSGWQNDYVGGNGVNPVERKLYLNDNGNGASRFFYSAKVSKKERGEGNVHPTVKPIKLMEYLITLVTPKGGVVLEPFMGSGSTGIAAKNLGMSFIGIEKEEEYFEIAKQRINNN